jgi:hypothetical protein
VAGQKQAHDFANTEFHPALLGGLHHPCLVRFATLDLGAHPGSATP